jgi:hypothetical protein
VSFETEFLPGCRLDTRRFMHTLNAVII